MFSNTLNPKPVEATAGSLTLDVRDGLLLVIARWYYRDLTNEYLPSSGVYEHLLGAIREQPGGGARASAQSVRYVCRQAATRRHGRRGPNSCHGDGDVCDEDLYRHVQAQQEKQSFWIHHIILVSTYYYPGLNSHMS